MLIWVNCGAMIDWWVLCLLCVGLLQLRSVGCLGFVVWVFLVVVVGVLVLISFLVWFSWFGWLLGIWWLADLRFLRMRFVVMWLWLF